MKLEPKHIRVLLGVITACSNTEAGGCR